MHNATHNVPTCTPVSAGSLTLSPMKGTHWNLTALAHSHSQPVSHWLMQEWSYHRKYQPHTFTHNLIIIMSHRIWCQPRLHRPLIVYDLPMLMSIVQCQGFLCHTSLMAIAPAQMFMPYPHVLKSIAPAQDCSCHTHINVHCSIPRVYAIPTLMSIAPTHACLCHTHIDAIAPSHYL